MPTTAGEVKVKVINDYDHDVTYTQLKSIFGLTQKHPEAKTKITDYTLTGAVKKVAAELELKKPKKDKKSKAKEKAQPTPEPVAPAPDLETPKESLPAVLWARRLNRRQGVFLTINTGMIGEAIGQPDLKDNDSVTINEEVLFTQLTIRNPLIVDEAYELAVPDVSQPGDGLHAVTSFEGDRPDTPIGDLAAELDTSIEFIAELAGLSWPSSPDTMANGEMVRGAYRARATRVGPAEPAAPVSTSTEILPARARTAMVGQRRGVRVIRDDKENLKWLTDLVVAILTQYPYRPDITEVYRTDDPETLFEAQVPTLVDPERYNKLDPMQYSAILSDPKGSFPVVTPRQEQVIAQAMEELSFVPTVCVNCQDSSGFSLGLIGKFWNLVNGLDKPAQGELPARYIRFYLPGCRRQFQTLYRELRLHFDELTELKFRKGHDECVIIASEVQALVSHRAFIGADWYDPKVREAFIDALHPRVRDRVPEIIQKTQGRIDRAKIMDRASMVVRHSFDLLDQNRASQEAGRKYLERTASA